MGASGGSTRVPRAKKIIFSKVVPRPLGMLKPVFFGRFEPVVARFGAWKVPKCLENGPFWDQKWVKNGSKTRFSKSDPRPFGMLKQVFLARFEPVLTEFSPFHHMYAPLTYTYTYTLTRAVLSEKWLFLAQNCADLGGHLPTWRPRPGPPAVSFWLKTWIWQGHHLGSKMAKVEPSPRHWEGAMVKTEW